MQLYKKFQLYSQDEQLRIASHLMDNFVCECKIDHHQFRTFIDHCADHDKSLTSVSNRQMKSIFKKLCEVQEVVQNDKGKKDNRFKKFKCPLKKCRNKAEFSTRLFNEHIDKHLPSDLICNEETEEIYLYIKNHNHIDQADSLEFPEAS